MPICYVALENYSLAKTIKSFNVLVTTMLFLLSAMASADGGVTFNDIAANDGAGVDYRRAPSASESTYQALKERTLLDEDNDGQSDAPLTVFEIPTVPLKSRGAPGTALFDYDLDGDLDLYVTNGPGVANSLYSNQIQESGSVQFIDLGTTAGVDAPDQDSTGVCFGDLDNDGDQELLVLGNSEPNRLFDNQGNGTFAEVTVSSGIGGGTSGSASCAMGDVDGDGYLDIFVGNTFDMSVQFAIFVFPFAFNEHNQLFLNDGDMTFIDVSATSGIQDLAGFPPSEAGAAGITWAVAMVDLDLDGDLDLVAAEDQAAILPTREGGVDRGYIHVFQNDGTGQFTDVTVDVGLDRFGAWMGLAFGDFDHNGRMDIFGANLGDFMWQILPPPFFVGDLSSRWFLGQDDGTFSDPGTGDLVVTPFGWGSAAFDYDNDGDTDILYHGGLDFTPGIDLSNPGALLQNDGSAVFSRDAVALEESTNHTLRVVNGMAVGDLDGDHFVDVVSVSNEDAPPSVPLTVYPAATGGPFAPESVFVDMFIPSGPDEFVWSGLVFADGTLSVELNSGDNGNGGTSIDLLGTVDLTEDGQVNRDGIGAVIFFTPDGAETAMKPILGGSSHASQHSLTAHFGLGNARRGTVEVLWPGGVRNRLYRVNAGESILFPEIPCSLDGNFANAGAYNRCVREALDDLVDEDILTARQRARFLSSAMQAFNN